VSIVSIIAQLDSLRFTFHPRYCSQPTRQWNNGQIPFMAPFGRRHGEGSTGILARFDRLAGRGLEYNPGRRKTNALIGSVEMAENGSLRIKLGLVVRVPKTIPSAPLKSNGQQLRFRVRVVSVEKIAAKHRTSRRSLPMSYRQLGRRQHMADGKAGQFIYFRERAEDDGFGAAPAFPVDQINACPRVTKCASG
jgi:hypothetical protein